MPRLGRAAELYSRGNDRVGQRASPINKPSQDDSRIRSRVRTTKKIRRKLVKNVTFFLERRVSARIVKRVEVGRY